MTIAVPALAHSQGWDSVDTSTNPPEIRYTESTSYDAANNNAISAWEGLPGGVSIAPDTWQTVNDLEITDLASTSNWAGRLVWNVGTDNLNYNPNKMDGYSSSKKRNVALHEWGHAHRLDHSWQGQVMYDTVSTVDTLQAHDKADYDEFWGS